MKDETYWGLQLGIQIINKKKLIKVLLYTATLLEGEIFLLGEVGSETFRVDGIA